MNMLKQTITKTIAIAALGFVLATTVTTHGNNSARVPESTEQTTETRTRKPSQSQKLNLFKYRGVKKAWLALGGLFIAANGISFVEYAAGDGSYLSRFPKLHNIRWAASALFSAILGARVIYRDYHDTSE